MSREQRGEHTKPEHIGRIFIEIDIKDLASDGAGNRCTEEVGTAEFANTGNQHGLLQRDGLGRDRGGECVGNIVGTYEETIHETEDTGEYGHPEVLVEGSHDDGDEVLKYL